MHYRLFQSFFEDRIQHVWCEGSIKFQTWWSFKIASRHLWLQANYQILDVIWHLRSRKAHDDPLIPHHSWEILISQVFDIYFTIFVNVLCFPSYLYNNLIELIIILWWVVSTDSRSRTGTIPELVLNRTKFKYMGQYSVL